jgi:glycosyltransferase involved in cell wall biosynthesis
MKIAIASSGLGHVARGVETWARDTADAIASRGGDVTLFAGAPLVATPGGAPVVALRCRRRYARGSQRLAGLTPAFCWRWGLKDTYGWEQFTFARALRRHLRRGRFDIVHVQDPMVAWWCRRWRERGLLATREILAHGTEESPAFLSRFPYVQHLAPWHLDDVRTALGHPDRNPPRARWSAIPNFVDTRIFTHANNNAERAACRTQFGLPVDARILGCVAVVKKVHKRIDYLIDEFGRALAHPTAGPPWHLVVAGARQPESVELVALARQRAPGRVHLLFDLSRDDMPALYRGFDAFALTSLFEMMPIALLEAMASGLPVLVNDHPVLAWMAGAAEPDPAGFTLDMSHPGALEVAVAALTPDSMRALGANARHQAESRFAREPVIDSYLAYYEQVMA